MNTRLKTVSLAVLVLVVYYALQYGSSAVHYNCAILKDDCPPPIYGTAEIIYRIMVLPPWLDKFEIVPMTYAFQDGTFTFWAGEVKGKSVVLRIREDESPTMEWIRDYPGIPMYPATGEHVKQWLTEHPEYELSR
jgi:hypothetical protein